MENNSLPYFRNPIVLALDVDDREEALRIVEPLAPYLGGIKIGPRLALRYGAQFTQELSQLAPVFLDCKFLDIPSTMVSAVRAAFEAGASVATVHALAGATALQELAKLEAELNQKRPFLILSVTVLTSFNQENLPSCLNDKPVNKLVDSLASDVFAAGLKGIVCSPQEASQIRSSNSKAYIVTPGIRAISAADDQKRVLTAQEALLAGSNALVIGRPILNAKDPLKAIHEIHDQIQL